MHAAALLRKLKLVICAPISGLSEAGFFVRALRGTARGFYRGAASRIGLNGRVSLRRIGLVNRRVHLWALDEIRLGRVESRSAF
jgi:hypothetical protein